jgi:hypothetical protein
MVRLDFRRKKHVKNTVFFESDGEKVFKGEKGPKLPFGAVMPERGWRHEGSCRDN